jgi:hypothetical protein
MENLINQENLEDIKELIESKIADVPGELILFGAIGTLLLSTYLNKTGHKQAGSLIGKLSIPIIGIGLAKYKNLLKSELENPQAPMQETHNNNNNNNNNI